METEVTKSLTATKIGLIIIVIISALLIYYAVMLIISPGRKLVMMNTEYGIKPDQKNPLSPEILSDSAYLSLLKEKAFLQSKTVMAQTDSIYLTINLRDSTTTLEISGVTVHSVKISSYQISRLFMKADEHIISTMLSVPLTVENSLATIKREPVMIKVAPKDTSEYKPDITPDTSIVEQVCYILEMKNGIRIYVYQEEADQTSEKSVFHFDMADRLRNTWTSIRSVARFRVPEYHPFIRIKIPRNDGKIIYRALPKKGQITLYT